MKRVLGKEHLQGEEPLGGLAGWVARKLGVPPWGQVLILALVFLLLAFGSVLWSGYSRLNKIESAVWVLASQQSPQSRDLVRDLLSQARKDAVSGNVDQAVAATQLAVAYVSSAKKERIPAPAEYFGELLDSLDATNLAHGRQDLVQASFGARVALAEYRSALYTSPQLPSVQKAVRNTSVIPPPDRVDPVSISGTVLRSNLPPGADFLSVSSPRLLSRNISVGGITFVGGSQTLDGIHWVNVTFVNTFVRYEGGEAELRNVRFVNCTFQFAGGPGGTALANYVVLEMPTVVVG